jgi:hypothetical protein
MDWHQESDYSDRALFYYSRWQVIYLSYSYMVETHHTKCTIDLLLNFSCLKNKTIPFSFKEGLIMYHIY